jgi:hypothetical protein
VINIFDQDEQEELFNSVSSELLENLHFEGCNLRVLLVSVGVLGDGGFGVRLFVHLHFVRLGVFQRDFMVDKLLFWDCNFQLRQVGSVLQREPSLPAVLGRLRQANDHVHDARAVDKLRNVLHVRRRQCRGDLELFALFVGLSRCNEHCLQLSKTVVDHESLVGNSRLASFHEFAHDVICRNSLNTEFVGSLSTSQINHVELSLLEL